MQITPNQPPKMVVTPNPLPDYVAKVVLKVTGKTWEELGDNVVFTVGNTLHARCQVPDYLMVHERVHMKQQGDTPEVWWKNYLDPDFSYSQELEAYRAEYQFLKEKDRESAIKAAHEFAKALGGEMYGGCVAGNKALLDIIRK